MKNDCIERDLVATAEVINFLAEKQITLGGASYALQIASKIVYDKIMDNFNGGGTYLQAKEKLLEAIPIITVEKVRDNFNDIKENRTSRKPYENHTNLPRPHN